MIGIYKFTNKLTGESYIGQSTNIRKRYINHRCTYKVDKATGMAKENTYFHHMLDYYGFDNFDFEVIEECSKDELNDKEMYYISKFNTLYPNGYNRTNGGNDVVYQKINDKMLKDIYADLENNELTQNQIAEKYGLHFTTISQINLGYSRIDKNRKYPIRKVELQKYYCKCCGEQLFEKTKTGFCQKCYQKNKTSYIPCKDELYNLLLQKSFSSVARLFGVTDNAVRKWCDKYNIPRHSSYYRNVA